jgi:hypothetical protein
MVKGSVIFTGNLWMFINAHIFIAGWPYAKFSRSHSIPGILPALDMIASACLW